MTGSAGVQFLTGAAIFGVGTAVKIGSFGI